MKEIGKIAQEAFRGEDATPAFVYRLGNLSGNLFTIEGSACNVGTFDEACGRGRV